MTPYLILDSEMEHALCFAAERVDANYHAWNSR